MSELKLNPCPFCGGAAITRLILSGARPQFGVRCSSCGGAVAATFIREEQAIETWNYRVTDSELSRLAAENERLRGTPEQLIEESSGAVDTAYLESLKSAPSLTESFSDLRAAGGDAWDKIDDPEAYLGRKEKPK